MSMDKLIKLIDEKQNPTVAGLDPVLDYVPQYIINESFECYGKCFKGAAEAILRFNKGLIDALCDIVPAVKPQSAYYEMYGIHGLYALQETIKYAKAKGMYVILDGKRNDIGSTAQAYSTAYLGVTSLGDIEERAFEPDGLTVNGYLGSDGVLPFVKDCEKYGKTIFTLVKTSNPSSGELQDLMLDGGGTVYEKMAEMVNTWALKSMGKSGYSNVGCVVGATYPEQAAFLRKLMPNVYFLVPGYGAQGGGAKDVANAFNKDGKGAIVNSSRAIMCAYKQQGREETEFAEAARDEALRMKADLLNAII